MLTSARATYSDDAFLGEPTSSEKDQDYKNLPSNAEALRTSLDTAVRMDEQQVTSFLDELKEVWEHKLNYFADREAFKQRCQDVVDDAYAQLEQVEGTVTQLKKFLGIPERLTGEFHEWSAHARELKAVIDPIPDYGQIPDWHGPASNEYLTMTEVQVQACNELFPRAKNMAETLHVAESLNYGVLSGANSSIQTALGYMQQCVADSEGRFYVNTARCGAVLSQLAGLLEEVLYLADLPSGELQARLQDVESSASVLRSGWPSGSSQHGQEGVPSPEIDVTAPKAPAGANIDPDAPGSEGTER
ncbi:hypothetical protein [uncultured Tessaracoccus sp.]|uniref:hypothetical protein n=1 Tax=uncultured Tessaracoccus sp. TaxID=905023 RepID=UPI0026199E5A|nr:hypothetical protein [uncultured Tessaracoccus sp.]